MSANKRLSSPRSTGSVGPHFEAHVQASFVILMLTGGHAPLLPCWPVRELKLQGKVDGFETDDLIVTVCNETTGEERKLLGQVKHSIGFTNKNPTLSEVMNAAWSDFNNSLIFRKKKDKIALITGPINETDFRNVVWLLDYAKHTKDSAEYFRNVSQANFSPSKAQDKLDVFRYHLKMANNNVAITDEQLYQFLSDFHILGYDLGKESGVVLSLLHSHISQFDASYPEWAWSRVVDIVQSWNQDAGTVIVSKLPEDLRRAFAQKETKGIPTELAVPETIQSAADWNHHASAAAIAAALLVGKWNENNPFDADIIRRLVNGF